jgi:hypothetical protein
MDPILSRAKDPGAGAFSPYINRQSYATRDIKAGEEFFVSYGENWFLGRQEKLGVIPLYQDLALATHLHSRHQELAFPDHLKEELWETFVKQTHFNTSRPLHAYNFSDPTELDRLQTKSLTEIRIEQASHTPEFLQEHGICADHIEPKPSTLPQAGRGAFATRPLSKGSVVSHLPMVHVLDRRHLEKRKIESLDKTGRPRTFN